MSDDFDWSADNPDVVTPRQNCIAVYENVNGSIVVAARRNGTRTMTQLSSSPKSTPLL